MVAIARRAATPTRGDSLPAWPISLVLLGYPLWWVLGLGDMVWPLAAAVMVVLLRRTPLRVPRGFGIWMLFLVWVLCSFVQIDTPGRAVGFFYRYALYLSATVLFVYVFNARRALPTDKVVATLYGFWLITVVGGYLGILFPAFELRTPLAMVLPGPILNNELVHEMAVRRFTQWNPDAHNVIAPRPSAPYLYTNGWGNAYSLLTPFVLLHCARLHAKHSRWFVPAALAVPVSLVPAFLSLNRGMFVGLGVAGVYFAFRVMLRGDWRALLAIAGVGVVGLAALQVIPVEERLENRLEVSSTTDDRASLYAETFQRTLQSPLLGYGAPRPSYTAGAPSAGTQGQFWMVLFSHGFVGVALFVGWLLLLFVRTIRGPTTLALVCNTVILTTMVEIFYYGIMMTGLVIVMLAGAIGLGEAQDASARSREQRSQR